MQNTSAPAATEGTARIKAAASLLMKGGTLVNEPCEKCGGVQIRFGDKMACVNCGNEVKTATVAATTTAAITVTGNLSRAASMIEEKIVLLASEIRSESDISVQKQKAELLESYLRILEKTKSLVGC